MTIANLINVPGSWDSLQSWTFAHMAHHRQINDAILQQFGVVMPVYPFDPVTAENMSEFLYQHQQVHKKQDAILGIDPLNLLDVDWNDEAARSTWIQYNFSEHRQAAFTLRI